MCVYVCTYKDLYSFFFFALCRTRRGSCLLMCLLRCTHEVWHTKVFVDEKMFLEHIDQHAHEVYMCGSVYTQCWTSSSSLSHCQTVLLQLRADLLLLFLPWITLQVLSSLSTLLLNFPLFSSPIFPLRFFAFPVLPSQTLRCSSTRLTWIHANERMTENPTRRDVPLLTPSLTPFPPIWLLPWQRPDWVGWPASCLLSQTVI